MGRGFSAGSWIILCAALLAAGFGPWGCADDSGPYGTSAAWAANSRRATEAAERFGDAVVAHFSENDGAATGDALAVESLVEPKAQEGLAQMLSSLARPIDYAVMSVSGTESGPIEVVLLFSDARSQQAAFTLTIAIDGDKTAIASIVPGSSPAQPR